MTDFSETGFLVEAINLNNIKDVNLGKMILIGDGMSGKTEIIKPTLGQELIELKNAKDSGAISEQEYEEMKEKLKKSYE